ncbi:hypothetical protein D3C80_921080 [compost metagenome]
MRNIIVVDQQTLGRLHLTRLKLALFIEIVLGSATGDRPDHATEPIEYLLAQQFSIHRYLDRFILIGITRIVAQYHAVVCQGVLDKPIKRIVFKACDRLTRINLPRRPPQAIVIIAMQAFTIAIQPHALNLHGLVELIQPSDALATFEFAIFRLRPAGLDWPFPRCHCANLVRHLIMPDVVRANFTILLAPGIEQHCTGKHQVLIP